MQTFEHDVVVVGAGSGGYAAARTVGDFGCSAALVDHGPLGGLCILRGCMPSKAFLASSDAAQDARETGALGVHVGGVTVDMPYILRRKRELVKEFADYRIEGIAKFPLYSGRATFVSANELQVGDDTILRADKFIIATGSVVQPALVPGLAETRISRHRHGARVGTGAGFGHRVGRRLHGVRTRSVSFADGRQDDDADTQRSLADPHG